MSIKKIIERIKNIRYEVFNMCYALKTYIRDRKIYVEMNSKIYPKKGLNEKLGYICENKYKSQILTLTEEYGRLYIIIQECKREGKIIDGRMVPEPIENSYLKIDARNSFYYIEAFRKAGLRYSKSIK